MDLLAWDSLLYALKCTEAFPLISVGKALLSGVLVRVPITISY